MDEAGDPVAPILKRVRATFHPEEVILFGSRAYGTPRPDSDADLLVVLRRADPEAVHRWYAGWAEALASGVHLGVDLHACTVGEMHKRLAHGDTVVRDALARGQVLYPQIPQSRYASFAREWSRGGAVTSWLRTAREDLESARVLLQAGRPVWRHVAFFAQQAAEKALKALIFHLGAEPARTHDLTDLALDVAERDRVLGRDLLLRFGASLGTMTPHAVEDRYPREGEVKEGAARAAFETATGVVEAVAQTLAAQGGAGYGRHGAPAPGRGEGEGPAGH